MTETSPQSDMDRRGVVFVGTVVAAGLALLYLLAGANPLLFVTIPVAWLGYVLCSGGHGLRSSACLGIAAGLLWTVFVLGTVLEVVGQSTYPAVFSALLARLHYFACPVYAIAYGLALSRTDLPLSMALVAPLLFWLPALGLGHVMVAMLMPAELSGDRILGLLLVGAFIFQGLALFLGSALGVGAAAILRRSRGRRQRPILG